MKLKMEKSVFETLFEVNVNDHVEKKNGLSYLSWPYAWAEVKNVFQMQITKFMKRKQVVFTLPMAKLVG